MKILVIGSGGREHALAWKLAQASQAEQVYVAPGNAGTTLENNLTNINIAATDIENLAAFAQKNQIDLTVVGPEVPLAAGVVDYFQAAGLNIFGPSQACAQLEASKTFSKQFMVTHNIPTAFYESFTEVEPALAFIAKHGAPIVVKADGLAAGKGVIVAQTVAEAEAAVQDMLADNKFGAAGARVVIEEFLDGIEFSYIAMLDGKTIVPMASSQDHKARDDGDKGPNTGGMGAYSPAPMATAEIETMVLEQVMQPVLSGMATQGTPYSGFLYAGMMLTKNGPKVLEFNCRFGDPETQPIMSRLHGDFAQLCMQGAKGDLAEAKLSWDSRSAVGVIMASRNYPASYPKGEVIAGLNNVGGDIKVFHAGTQLKQDKVLTNGGRVLCVTALGDDLLAAQAKAYAAVEKISWPSVFWRGDIGAKGL
jgi:phosphoribosylamine--glycine ligase